MEVSSSVPESEQQQQEQQLKPSNLQSHEQSQPLIQCPQQPHQIQDYHYQMQSQSYDQPYYSYYQQYPYQNQWQYNHQHQNYAYYQLDYSAAYPQPLDHQNESVHAASAQHEGAQIADSGGTGAPAFLQQQSAYPSSGNVLVPPGINPAAAAAIAALERLTQFAGTMGAAERAMAGFPVDNPCLGPVLARPPGGRHPHRGGGRRGGGWGSSAPSLRGRGRGRGRARSRHFLTKGVHPTSSAVAEHSADVAENAAQSAPALEKVAPKHQQIAWCELCRVDCTSLEILEQHKNGKRHKKNLLRIEELKNTIKAGEELQNDREPITDSKPEESQKPQVAQNVEEQKSAENLPSETTSNEPRIENNQQNSTEKLPEVAVEMSGKQEKKPRINTFDNRRRGMKRKMKGGWGGKRIKTSETHKRPTEPPKPKVVIPLICDLCNVKCDTREVLDRHLSGKKHIAKLIRFEGHQAMYGPKGLQVLYPPNPIAQTHFLSQGHQPFSGFLGSFPPQGGSFSSQAHQSAAGLDSQVSPSSMPQQSVATITLESQSSMHQQSVATVTPEANPATAV